MTTRSSITPGALARMHGELAAMEDNYRTALRAKAWGTAAKIRRLQVAYHEASPATQAAYRIQADTLDQMEVEGFGRRGTS